MISTSLVSNFQIAAGISLLIALYYRGELRIRPILWIFTIAIFGLSFFMLKKVIILREFGITLEQYSFKSTMPYIYANGDIALIPIKQNRTYVNDTRETYYVESVKYSSSASTTANNDENRTVFNAYSYQNFDFQIDYLLTEPPSSITVRRTSSETRYWMHR